MIHDDIALVIADGLPRQLCGDSGRRAVDLGMLKKAGEVTTSAVKVVIYEILPPHTLEDCRRLADAAHDDAAPDEAPSAAMH